MLLVPPRDSADPSPLFHVSVAANCFNPSSHVTTLRRGGSVSSAPVAEFEMGISHARATVTIGQRQISVDAALKKTVSRADTYGAFMWHFGEDPETHLMWEWKGTALSVRAQNEHL
jgi:hypothetical protein